MKKNVSSILFAAAAVSRETENECVRIQDQMRRTIPGSYPDQRNFHVTFAYLGNVPNERCQEAAAAAAAVPLHAGMLVFDHLENFAGGRGDTIVLASEPNEALAEYRARLHAEFQARGFPPEASVFIPHVTLVRAKISHVDISSLAVLKTCTQIDRVIVYRSFQMKGRRIYEPVICQGQEAALQ